MLLIRELMFCKPGKVKPLLELGKGYHDLVESGRREIYRIEN